jgi:arylsulfatase A-like enzyme
MLAAACGRGKDAPPAATNVLVVSIDALRADHLGCYGYERPTSPTLDALAARGVVFEDAVSPAPSTLPAHASLLTGRYPARPGTRRPGTTVAAGAATLAETLAAHGFRTGAVVNAAALSRRSGLDRGFESFLSVRDRVDSAEPSGVWDAAMMWLTKWRERPFFLFVHTSEVGSDYKAMASYETQFARPYDGIADGTRAQLLAFRGGRVSLGARDAGRLVDLYDAGIRQTDDGLARFLRMMRRLKVFDATLAVVTSGHGEELLDHGGVLHGHTLFQELIRVPLILVGPGVPAGRRVTETVSLVDVAPTIRRALGLASAAGTDGIDLRASWERAGASGLPARPIFAEADRKSGGDERSARGGGGEHGEDGNEATAVAGDGLYAVRAGRLKLIYDRATGQAALFDVVADPRERTDVAGGRPDAVRALRQRLEEYMGGAAAPQ